MLSGLPLLFNSSFLFQIPHFGIFPKFTFMRLQNCNLCPLMIGSINIQCNIAMKQTVWMPAWSQINWSDYLCIIRCICWKKFPWPEWPKWPELLEWLDDRELRRRLTVWYIWIGFYYQLSFQNNIIAYHCIVWSSTFFWVSLFCCSGSSIVSKCQTIRVGLSRQWTTSDDLGTHTVVTSPLQG